MKKTDAEEKNAFTIGDAVSSKCGACKTMTPHTIVSIVANKPAQVCCSTCNRFHKYRPATKPTATRVKKNPDLEEWQKLSAGWSNAKTITYSTTKTYKLNVIVKHSKFGLGQVKQIMEAQKMRVLFESGMKLMVYGR